MGWFHAARGPPGASAVVTQDRVLTPRFCRTQTVPAAGTGLGGDVGQGKEDLLRVVKDMSSLKSHSPDLSSTPVIHPVGTDM